MSDTRLLRKLIHQRYLRRQFFDRTLFADPVWDMLLDLMLSKELGKRVSVTSLCIASNVPAATALRHIEKMLHAGLIRRIGDRRDRRRVFIEMTDHASISMSDYLAELEA